MNLHKFVSYKTRHKLQKFWAGILPICVECKYIPGDSTICYTCLYIYSAVNMLHVVSTEGYVCNVCRSSASARLIHRFPVPQIFQLLISNYIKQAVWYLRNGINLSNVPQVKTLFLNNWWTCIFVLGNFQGTHNCSEVSVVYLVT